MLPTIKTSYILQIFLYSLKIIIHSGLFAFNSLFKKLHTAKHLNVGTSHQPLNGFELMSQ